MTKTYTFYDDSWWSSACDCCEPTEMPAFNSNELTPIFGTAHSVEDCYVQAIKIESAAYMEDEGLWELDLDNLKKIAKELCIRVEIIS